MVDIGCEEGRHSGREKGKRARNIYRFLVCVLVITCPKIHSFRLMFFPWHFTCQTKFSSMRDFSLSTRPFESVYLFIFFSVEKTVENIFFDGYEESIKANRHCVFFFFLRNSQFQLRPLTPHLSPCRFVPITYGCTLQRCFPLIRFLFPFSFFLPRLLCEIGRRATQSRAARNSNYIHIRVHL